MQSGALVLETSPSAKGMNNILVDDKDKYAISPCADKKWVVVGLSEDILVKQIIIANYEKYSSIVSEFQVLGSQTFPTQEVSERSEAKRASFGKTRRDETRVRATTTTKINLLFRSCLH